MSNEETQNSSFKGTMDILEFSERVDSLADELLNLLKTTDSQVLAGIKPYIDPRKNICKILAFYDVFLSTTKQFQEIQIEFDKNQLLLKSQKDAIEIEELEANGTLGLAMSINRAIAAFKEFEDVKIVSKALKDMKELEDQAMDMIEQSILVSLKRLPKVVDKLDTYTKFILDYREGSKFMEAYTSICLQRLGFAGIENNCAIILQRTKNLTAHFNMIIDFNSRILGKKRSRATNDGLVKLMILDLKKILSDTLSKIEVDDKPDYIPFLIRLYARLRHSDGNLIKEIEELFVFKEDILTIIFNCSINFLVESGLKTTPNKELREERVVHLLAEILAQFNKHKEVKRAWVEKSGPSFGVHSSKELNSNFVGKAFQAINRRAESLGIEEKAIYLINNMHGFKDLAVKVSGHEVRQIIYKNCETIVGIWKINLGNHEYASLNTILIQNLDSSRKYYLPEEERVYVVDKIKGVLQDFVARKKFDGNLQVMLDKISVAYSGS